MDRLSGAPAGRPERTQHKAFGDLAAVWGILDRLGVADAIDAVCGPRRSDAGASVGTYLALATANRVVAPCSKLGFEQWRATTAGPRFTKVRVAATDHRFWDAMDNLDTTKLAAAERAIAATMVSEFGLDLSGLALDMTNFATFIDSTGEAAPIAQRGHAKQKRNDLRLVGLALVVTRDRAIPVTSHAYPGNRPDVTQFGAVLDELTSRYAALLDTHGDADTADSAPSGPTVVFDAGQNSAANFAHLTGAGLHYVGSLPPSSFPDLLAIPARRRHPVDPHKYPGLSAYDTRAMVFGVDRRVVLTHSANLHAKQGAGLDQTLAKTTRDLGELAATLARGKTRREPDAVLAEVTRITHPRWVARVLTTQLTGTTPATMRLTWQIDDAARKALESEIFGKRLYDIFGLDTYAPRR